MNDHCEKCELAHAKIANLEVRVESLENFKKWAEPILKSIIILVNDEKWKKWVFGVFIGLVSYIYVYQIYPSFEKQHEAEIETRKIIHEFKEAVIKELSSTAQNINTHSTNASKTNYKAIKNSMREEISKRINPTPPFSVHQTVGKGSQ